MSKLIPLAQAIEMTSLFRKEKENILNDFYQNKNILTICETFDRSDFDSVLSQPACVQLRIYYGMDAASMQVHAIIVGVDSKGNDILSTNGAAGNELAESGIDRIVEEGNRCPPVCPPPSPLNGG